MKHRVSRSKDKDPSGSVESDHAPGGDGGGSPNQGLDPENMAKGPTHPRYRGKGSRDWNDM